MTWYSIRKFDHSNNPNIKLRRMSKILFSSSEIVTPIPQEEAFLSGKEAKYETLVARRCHGLPAPASNDVIYYGSVCNVFFFSRWRSAILHPKVVIRGKVTSFENYYCSDVGHMQENYSNTWRQTDISVLRFGTQLKKRIVWSSLCATTTIIINVFPPN